MKKSDSASTPDLIIVGSGQAASPLARDAAAAGWKVTVVEESHPGGTCVNTGCTPTKTLVASSRAAYIVTQSSLWGVTSLEQKIDWPAIRRRRDKIVEDFRA